MPATYEPIATTTVSGTSTTAVDFSGFGTGYTDLILISSAAISATGFSLSLRVGTTGSVDTTTKYSRVYFLGNGSSNSANRDANSTFIDLNGTSYTSGTPATAITQFMSYGNSLNKTILSRSGAASDSLQMEIGSYRSTSAINFIRVYVASGFIYTGSTFTLYGIKAA
jgi:hypothetical protein